MKESAANPPLPVSALRASEGEPTRNPVLPTAKPTRRVRATRSTSQVHGDETRAKIIAACMETVRTAGITGSSARAIARVGEFNQALIFYHFGSIDGLLVTVAKVEGENRALRYTDAFENVTNLKELIAVARAVHIEEQAQGTINVLTQLLAGAASSPELQAGILAATQPWMVLVENAIARVLAGSSLLSLVPLKDTAFAISSLFVGIELITGLDPTGQKAEGLFDSIEQLSSLLQMVIGNTK